MNRLQDFLETNLHRIIAAWDEEDIYAISFFVYANEAYAYRGYQNVTTFAVSYNTERDCGGAGKRSEERWNYAFWRQNEVAVIDAAEDDPGMALLFDWYHENGITNIGYEDPEGCYDEKMRYIGKGPAGYAQLLKEITAVARRLQESGFIAGQLGRPVPIIIHDLEYSWYTLEATRQANSGGEADVFLAAMQELGFGGSGGDGFCGDQYPGVPGAERADGEDRRRE